MFILITYFKKVWVNVYVKQIQIVIHIQIKYLPKTSFTNTNIIENFLYYYCMAWLLRIAYIQFILHNNEMLFLQYAIFFLLFVAERVHICRELFYANGHKEKEPTVL